MTRDVNAYEELRCSAVHLLETLTSDSDPEQYLFHQNQLQKFKAFSKRFKTKHLIKLHV